jgi:hypothetical protein
MSYDPGLFPKVVSKNGKQISNSDEPLRVFTDLKKAQTSAGENITIKADGVNDKNELIVSDDDAKKLLVNEGNIIIVR